MTRQMLTREQASTWSPDWSCTDRDVIEQNLSRLSPQTFYVPPSGGYVACIDAGGRIVMTLHPGYLEFQRGLAPADRPDAGWPGLTLSTFRPHGSPTASPKEGAQICPIHNLALPLTGICDECQ